MNFRKRSKTMMTIPLDNITFIEWIDKHYLSTTINSKLGTNYEFVGPSWNSYNDPTSSFIARIICTFSSAHNKLRNGVVLHVSNGIYKNKCMVVRRELFNNQALFIDIENLVLP